MHARKLVAELARCCWGIELARFGSDDREPCRYLGNGSRCSG